MDIGKVVEAFESREEPVLLHFPLDMHISMQNEIVLKGMYLRYDAEDFPGYGLEGPVVNAHLVVKNLRETAKNGETFLEAYGALITFYTNRAIVIADPNGKLYSQNSKWFILPENRVQALHEVLDNGFKQ